MTNLEALARKTAETKTIHLNRGLEVIVDVADYHWLNQYKWHAQQSSEDLMIGHCQHCGYRFEKPPLDRQKAVADSPTKEKK